MHECMTHTLRFNMISISSVRRVRVALVVCNHRDCDKALCIPSLRGMFVYKDTPSIDARILLAIGGSGVVSISSMNSVEFSDMFLIV